MKVGAQTRSRSRRPSSVVARNKREQEQAGMKQSRQQITHNHGWWSGSVHDMRRPRIVMTSHDRITIS